MNKKGADGFDVAVIGGGIVGLAMALAAAKRGLKTAVFERNPRPVGASIRNFGLLWPVGQPAATFRRAMRSREIWLDLFKKTGIWNAPTGSLTLAYADDELAVIEAFFEKNRSSKIGYDIELLSPSAAQARSSFIQTDGLRGGLFSKTEINIDPRQAIDFLQKYLKNELGVAFFPSTAISETTSGRLYSGWREWRAAQIFICSGADFETLFPDIFIQSGFTKCKLQMMRTEPMPSGWQLGPALCAGLTLTHYESFAGCESLDDLKKRFAAELPEHVAAGIHVLVSQSATGELVLGDTHEYGLDLSPFDKNRLNDLVLSYLKTFFRLSLPPVAETWHGIYPKMKTGKTEFVHTVEPGVTIVNGLGGAGMTLSFGLAEEVLEKEILKKTRNGVPVYD